ncbi:transcriptional-regulating factor 1-like [Zerene cesonia]|uniref:transcriptional-regulating factor 1-like n=1 Tax=Zerene cesonia TaxID=33412 RepID=UPI0018E59924|nr:transcriptional-regulating factor 1-like [Zerene cesonia]
MWGQYCQVCCPLQTSNGSEKSSGTSTSGSGSGDSSPPRTPPAPPPPRPKPKARPKATNATQQGSPKCGSGTAASGTPSNATSVGGSGIRSSDIKPVECNLCHRKFKNIPALNGHMRLHGGYFKKDSDNKKLDKKESTGPPLQTASVSVRALIEEKIISRRGATTTTQPIGVTVDTSSRSGFATPAPPPLSNIRSSSTSPASPVTTSVHFVSPKAPPAVTFANNATSNPSVHRDSTLIELLKKGNSKVVKRSASDPGQSSPQQDFTFRPELFGVSFNSDDGYFSPALNEDTFQFATTADQLEELASLEDYATVAASIHERSPVTFPSNRRLAAVLNSPLPESLADFGACHGGPAITSPGIPGYTENSPSLSYGDSPGLAYTAASPSGGYSTHPTPSPSLAYPTPPASQDAQSPAHSVPRASSPLTAAFFTATMSSQEEVEEALEEVLPEECRSLDAYTLQPSPTARRMMLNSEDPLLSSSPRDFPHQRSTRRHNRSMTPVSTSLQQWQSDHNSLQVCVEGRDPVPAVFLSPNSIPASPQRRKRKASPAGPYRSRMRRVTSHYTPQPMLQPDRDGPGLYVDLLNGLSNSEVDVLAQFEDNQKPQINIGPEHQADIPELCNDRIDLHRVPEQLLWDPGINDALDDNEVRMFMELAMCAAMPVGGHSRESALQTLGECGGDVRAATLRLMARPSPAPRDPRWAPHELEAFLAGLAHFDKDFYRIADLIRTKDSKQCVQFYYFWKKVTKDYKTLYLRSWSDSQPTQGSLGQPLAPALATSPSFEGEEFPCKICGKVFNKVKSRSAHMKSHRPLDAEPKRPKLEKPYEKVERSDDRSQATTEYQNKTPTQ